MGSHLTPPLKGWLLTICFGAGTMLLGAPMAKAQSQRFLLGPGTNVGPNTQVKPENCKTAADGTITCDTKLVNPPGESPAKPQYNQFSQ
jgi:hypothetical protein